MAREVEPRAVVNVYFGALAAPACRGQKRTKLQCLLKGPVLMEGGAGNDC